MENPKKARLYSGEAPSEEQKKRFEAFLEKKYNYPVELEWVKDETLKSGFRLHFEGEVYNWTPEGRWADQEVICTGRASRALYRVVLTWQTPPPGPLPSWLMFLATW